MKRRLLSMLLALALVVFSCPVLAEEPAVTEEAAPVETALAEIAPIEEVPAVEAPAVEAPAVEAPIEEIPVESNEIAPVDDIVIKNDTAVTGIDLSDTWMEMVSGASSLIIATIHPADATDKTVTWTSDDPSIATVSDGLVTAVSGGQTKIRATTSNGIYTECTVKVNIHVTGISLSEARVKMYVGGDTKKLTATVEPADATNKGVTYQSYNSYVVTVNSDGTLTAQHSGDATVVAISNEDASITDDCDVAVYTRISNIDAHTGKIHLNYGKTFQLSPSVSPWDADDQALVYSSSDASIVSVDQDGVLTAVGNGTVTITIAATDGSNVFTSFEVESFVPVTGVTVKDANGNTEGTLWTNNGTLQLTAAIEPANATNAEYSWSTNNAWVASVDSNGVVTAKHSGTCEIIAAAKDTTNTYVYGVYKLTVNVHATAIELTNKNGENGVTLNNVKNGKSYQFETKLTPVDSTYKELQWTSSDPSVASVDAKGKVTAVKGGTATITVKVIDESGAQAAVDSCIVTVLEPATKVELDGEEPTIDQGKTVQLKAKVTPDNATNKVVKWVSYNTWVATVDYDTGVVTGNNSGKAQISMRVYNEDGSFVEGICNVYVNVPVKSIKNYVTKYTLPVGQKIYLSAEAQPYNASNTGLIWASSNTEVATVSDKGLVTAIKEGNATITITSAANSNIKTTTQIIVTAPKKTYLVEEITLEKKTLTMYANSSAFIGVKKLIPDKATNKNVKWELTDIVPNEVGEDNFITVNEWNGKITARWGSKGGTATLVVTAKDGSGVFATAKITVKPVEEKIPVTGIKLGEVGRNTFEIGYATHFTYTVEPADATNKDIKVIVEDTNIAKFTDGNKIQGIKPGTTKVTIYPTDNLTVSVSFNVTVTEKAKENSLEFYPRDNSITAEVGKRLNMNTYVRGYYDDTVALTWSCDSDVSGVYVDEDGFLTVPADAENGKKATVTVYAQKNGSNGYMTAKTVVTIIGKSAGAKSVELSKTKASVAEDGTIKLKAEVLPKSTEYKTVTWVSSDESVATVDKNGKVTPVTSGSCIITAIASNGVSSSCVVTVKATKVKKIALNKKNATISIGEGEELGKTLVLTGKVTPTDATTKALKWKSSNTKVAIVDSNGIVTSVGYGKCTITATATDGSKVKATCKVTVSKKAVKSIKLTGKKNMTVAQTQQLTATFSPEKAYNKNLTWKSSNTKIATVDENGIVTALKKGNVTITCTAKGGKNVKTTFKITVKKAK